MALEALIARFGLAAVFAGAGLEGETAVIAGGILAHQGILSLPGVMIAGAFGSFLADQGFFILGFRFLYGLRTVSPVVIGTSDVPQMRFLLLNALAAISWSVLSAAIGYGLGGPLGHFFHRPRSIVPLLVGALLLVGVGAFAIRMVWKMARRHRQ